MGERTEGVEVTREYIKRAAADLITGTQCHSTASGALMEGDEPSADRMDGTARVFLLAALRLAGSGGDETQPYTPPQSDDDIAGEPGN